MLPLKTIRRIMKEAGADKVSKGAVTLAAKFAEEHIRDLTGKALIFMEHANRKTLLEKDVELTQLGVRI